MYIFDIVDWIIIGKHGLCGYRFYYLLYALQKAKIYSVWNFQKIYTLFAVGFVVWAQCLKSAQKKLFD